VTTRHAAVPGEAAQLSVLVQFLRDFWSQEGLAPTGLQAFELALEELFVNIVTHGSRPGVAPRVEVSLSLSADGVTMIVEDDGPPFNPLSLAPPDLEAGIGDRQVGGLGVFLVQRTMDAVSYERDGARNRLRMLRNIPA
jgi:serine/threonine-protein kinase RsbW